MTILAFKDAQGYEVVTAAWSACVKDDEIDVAYLWGADGISWFDSATGVCRIRFKMTMSQFLSSQRNGMIDLRS